MCDDTIENKAANDAATAASTKNIHSAASVHGFQAPKEHPSHTTAYDFRAIAIAITGWILPGCGHALLRMWGRAVTVFLAVGFLVYLGAGMRGNLFAPGGEDAFARLGYAADLGTGSFYFIARSLEITGADVSHADGDYGTRFLATAGVLNLLAALHAYEAARRRKA
jgi:mannose/fructose/N-acetylgalactosamine-specific phosphotransferase system component IIC